MCAFKHSRRQLLFVLLGSAAFHSLCGIAAAHAVADTRQLVPQSSSTAFPFSAVGQLANGCTGFLIGPCHVMTVAHCVVEPWRNTWWKGLDFYPGRNVPESDTASGWAPLGVAYKQDVAVHPNWTNSASGMRGKPAADAAIIITKQALGRQVGWLDHRLPSAATIAAAVRERSQTGIAGDALLAQQQQQQLLLQQAQVVGTEAPSAALVEQLVEAAGLPLHVVGYPDNKSNGSMWQQCCSKLDWQLQGNLLWHDCAVRGGNSGSPVWVVWPPDQTPQASSASQAAGTASSTGRKLLQDDGNSSSSSSSSSPSSGRNSAAAASGTVAQLAGYVQVVGVHSSSLKLPYTSQLGAYAEALYAQRASTAAAAPAAAAAATNGLDVVNSSKLRSDSCVGGAGGREADGVNVLLPVAVPFTADTYAWIDDVLQKHTCSDG